MEGAVVVVAVGEGSHFPFGLNFGIPGATVQRLLSDRASEEVLQLRFGNGHTFALLFGLEGEDHVGLVVHDHLDAILQAARNFDGTRRPGNHRRVASPVAQSANLGCHKASAAQQNSSKT
eukprot:Skav212881  [mRNA]  locus=scaffold1006:159616:165505:- [translate_table: standard]